MRSFVFTLLLLFSVANVSSFIKLPVFNYLQSTNLWLLAAALGLALYSLIKDQSWLTKHKPRIQQVAFLSLVIFAIIVFFLLPTRRTQSAPEGLGDSLWLIEIIFTASKTIGWWTSFDEILEPLIRSIFVKLATNDIESILFWLGVYSSVCGFLLVVIIWFFFRGHLVPIRIASFLLLFFVPSTQIFLNYIEHYSFAALSIITILLLIWKDLDNQSIRVNVPVLVAAIAAVGVLHHLIVGFLLPALIIYLVKRSSSSREFLTSAIQSSITGLLIIAIGWFFYFVVLQESTQGSHLWHPPILSLHKLFSSSNVVKVLSIILFTSPLIVVLIIKNFANRPKAYLSNDSVSSVLMVAIISFLVQLILWNPIIGLPADWDLLSFVSLPIHVFILRQFSFRKSIPLVGIATLTLLPALLWWWSNHQLTAVDQTSRNQAIQYAKSAVQAMESSPNWSQIAHNRKRQLLLLRLLSVKLAENHMLELYFQAAEKAALATDQEFNEKIALLMSKLEEASHD